MLDDFLLFSYKPMSASSCQYFILYTSLPCFTVNLQEAHIVRPKAQRLSPEMMAEMPEVRPERGRAFSGSLLTWVVVLEPSFLTNSLSFYYIYQSGRLEPGDKQLYIYFRNYTFFEGGRVKSPFSCQVFVISAYILTS